MILQTSEEWAGKRQVLIHLGGWVHVYFNVIYDLLCHIDIFAITVLEYIIIFPLI